VIRYSDSGTTHMNGTLAMFWVTWLLTASNITEPMPDNASHSNGVPSVGGGAAVVLPPVACSSPARAASRTEARPVAAHSTTNSV